MPTDKSKFRRKSLYKICDWSEVTALVTNDGVDPDLVDRVRRQTEVIFC